MHPRSRLSLFAVFLTFASVAARAGAEAPAGEVTISTDEYKALLESAAKAKAAREEKDRGDAIVSGARFTLAIEGDRAKLEETFEIRSDASDWTLLPIVHDSFELSEITPAAGGFFFTGRDGSLTLALASAGVWRARLLTTLRATEGGEGWRGVTVTVPLFPVHSGRIDAKGPDLEINVTGAEVLSRSNTPATASVEVATRPGTKVVVAWREKTALVKSREGPLHASGDLYVQSRVEGGEVVTDVHALIVATSGSIAGIDLVVPAGARVLFLRGAGLLDWSESDGHVKSARASASPYPLEAHLRFTRPLAADDRIELPLPGLVVPGKTSLWLDFRAPEGQLAEPVDNGSFTVAEVEQVPAAFRGLVADAEEVLRLGSGTTTPPRPPVYRLHRLAAAPVLAAQVRAERGTTLVARSGRTLTRVEFDVVSSAKSFLILRLPEGSELWGAESRGQPILAAAPEPGTVALPLRSARGRFARVAVHYLGAVKLPEGAGTFDLALPAADVPVSRLSWTLSLPGGAAYKLEGTEYTQGAGTERAAADAEADEEDEEDAGSGLEDAGGFCRLALRVLAAEPESSGRTPIVPRWPALPLTIAVSSELPVAAPPPVRIRREPQEIKEEWR
jgi:hypothetical protein